MKYPSCNLKFIIHLVTLTSNERFPTFPRKIIVLPIRKYSYYNWNLNFLKPDYSF